ncbi:MAG: TetR/AcrR family transcriptional regulator [Acidimicrobiales bacterium]|nr:TetR/AcrR family transcriptional regulator [Acidimicrobiales bacterium]
MAAYSPAQRRTLDAALELFAEHGVGGTSLAMIADAVGVTKAAVYHQFSTKEAILLAVIDVQTQPLVAALDAAEAAGATADARRALLGALVDTVVGNRRALSTLQSDPVLLRLLGEHDPSRRFWARFYSVLLGHDLDDRARVRAAVLSAAIGSVAHPFAIEVDNDVVRAELLALTEPLLAD